MTAGRAARRYAAALFDVTEKNRSSDRAERELTDLAQALLSHAELSRVIASPAVPASVKKTIVTEIIKKAGVVSAEVQRVVAMLADRDRLDIVSDVASAYASRVMDARRVVRAEVTTALPLSAATRTALGEALGRATGREVTITERVDPAIVGGIVARVGSVVYDGSVTRQLERLRERLTQGN